MDTKVLKRFSLTQQLVFGFTALVAVTALLSLNSSRVLEENFQTFTGIIDLEMQKQLDVAELNKGLVELQRAEKNMVLAVTRDEMEKYEASIQKNSEQIRSILVHLESIVDSEGGALLNQFEVAYARFESIQEQIRKLTLQNANERARALSQNQARQAFDNAKAAMRRVVSLNDLQNDSLLEALESRDQRVATETLDKLGRLTDKIRLATSINLNLVELQRAEKNLILARSDFEMEEYNRFIGTVRATLEDRLAKLRSLLDSSLDRDVAGQSSEFVVTEQAAFDQFLESYETYLSLHDQVREIAVANSNVRAATLSREDARAAFDRAEAALLGLTAKVQADTQRARDNADQNYADFKNSTLLLVIGALGLAIAIAYLLARTIRSRVVGLAAFANRIASGDLDVRFKEQTSRDELNSVENALENIRVSFAEITQLAGDLALGASVDYLQPRSENDPLADAINRLRDRAHNIETVAQSIAAGEMNSEIIVNSQKDRLGMALQDMQEALLSSKISIERQRWLDEGINLVNATMQGDQDTRSLATGVVAGLADYLGAEVGALYVRDSNSNGDTNAVKFELLGSYAFSQRKHMQISFGLGESLIGQAALERKTIEMSQVPDDYLMIRSGIGESKPNALLLVPMVYRDTVYAVMELGVSHSFNPSARELLQRVTESIAIAFSAAESKYQLAQALEESQFLTEELKQQQEELRLSNDELEQQARALESSKSEVEQRNLSLISAQNELNERAEQLRQSNRYKSEFLANMSHELRTPLNSIMLLSKMMSNGSFEDGDELRRNSKVIYDAGRDLLQLINEVLDLAKIEAGKMSTHLKEIAPSEFVHTMQPLFEAVAAEKKLKFSLSSDETLPASIVTDPDRLTQVLRNLLSNAFKFTQKGEVELTAGQVTPDIVASLQGVGSIQQQIKLNPSDYIAFTVRDTGIGIERGSQSMVFEAFQQVDGATNRHYSGTGLGLSISTQIAEMLGGCMALTSAPNKGSIFSIILPNSTELVPANTQIAPKTQPVRNTVDMAPPSNMPLLKDDQMITSPKDERILLVVDDDSSFAASLLQLGRQRNFKMLYAATGTDALRLAEHYIPDGIILDIQLPIVDGWDVLRKLKERISTSHIPVYVISSTDKDPLAFRLGALDFISKPVMPEQIAEAFDAFEKVISQGAGKVLVVEDDEIQREVIIKLLSCEGVVECDGVGTSQEALQALRTNQYSAYTVDLRLPDSSGLELLQSVSEDPVIERIPAVVYTGKDLSVEDERSLRRYAESIVIKTASSPGRLLQDVTRFLHQPSSKLSHDKRSLIEQESVLDSEFVGRTILLVDDDIRNSFSLGAVLDRVGVDVLTAQNGEEALEVLADTQSDVDLILMDIMMPVMDGFEAIEQIRSDSKLAQIPIIALTAKALREDRQRCLDAGASDYLAKPLDVDQLFTMMRALLGGDK